MKLNRNKYSSVSNRFSFVLIGVVTIILFSFAAVGIFIDIGKIEKDLHSRLDNALRLAQKSLPTPLWNLDNDVAQDFVEALFLNNSIVYTKVTWGDKIISEKVRQGHEKQNFSDVEFIRKQFIAGDSNIFFENKEVGQISIVMSRDSVKNQIIRSIYSTIALTIFFILAILLTTVLVTKKYISAPLLKLQESASLIARGDLDAFVDKNGNDEIGMLSRHLDEMRRSIKEFLAELQTKTNQIEEQKQTLETQVNLRTQELSRTVEELKALGEISQAVSSTLDLETVLKSIVRHAVQLSKADAGTIYEFDEATENFIPSINYGINHDLVEAYRKAGLYVGDKTAMGQAALSQSPYQIPDLSKVSDYPIKRLQNGRYQAILAVPLLLKNRLFGGLIIRRTTSGEFSDKVLNLLQSFAAQSSVAIHNARLFREVEEKGRELKIVNKHKSEFLANMSHELRTPLNAILGYTELIIDDIYGPVPEKMKEVLERIDKNGRHLLGLINDVLDLSKIDAGRLILSLTDYSMSDMIETVLSSVESLAAEKRLKIISEVPSDLPLGKGDEQRVLQVLLNLIGNAIKFTEIGEIKVKVGVKNDKFKISVSDTGPGLLESDQRRIFEEFHQVDTSSTREKGGTGLGLSISNKIIKMHGGDIWVESKFGKGSKFQFTIPIRVKQQKV